MPAIYLDHAATTPTDADIAAQVARDLVRYYANPSSAHRPGREAKAALEDARRAIEARVGGLRCVFTASGSEGIHLAMRGAFARRAAGCDRVLLTSVEHPAGRQAAQDLVREGARPETIPVDAEGRIDLAAFERALGERDDVAVVTLLHVQNELGTIEPVEEVGRLVRLRAPRATYVVDAVQSLGKVPVDPRAMGAHAVAIAGHKIHGPKGMGALLLDPQAQIAPQVTGAGQEGGLRSGTECVAGAIGLATAVARAVDGLADNAARMASLRARLVAGLLARVPRAALNGPADPSRASPAIVNMSFPGAPSVALLEALEGDEIYVAAGSACKSGGKPNPVHEAVGLAPERRLSTVRFGLSWHTEAAEIDRAIERVTHHVARLRGPT